MMFSSNYVIFFVIFIFKAVYSQQEIGDLCNVKATGSSGTCKVFSECTQAQEELRKFNRWPQKCGFKGTQSIVCCPNDGGQQRKPGETSYKKCAEYSKYVFEKKKAPTLLIRPTDITRNECGHKVVTLIVGGELAGRKEFPHMAIVGYSESANSIKWICGGTILSEKYILTAGHCLVSKDYGPATHVAVGITNLKDNDRKQELKIAQRISHPEYKSSSHYHDVALLLLESAIKLDPFTVPACLYTTPEVTFERAIATGWGDTSYGGTNSDNLLKVTLNMIDHGNCNASYKNQISRKLKNGIVDSNQMCAGSDEEKDTCQGDSGGPLQIYHVNDDIKCMYDVVGVTSFGKACTGSPGVYTRVSYYTKWIEDIVWPPS